MASKRISKNQSGITAKKSLGQNFLVSKSALSAIIGAGDPAHETVLEIGPGKGVLTEKLLALAEKVIAVEKDSRLIPYLEGKFIKEISKGKLKLIEGDILELGAEALGLKNQNYKLIANIPYYITGQVIRKFLEDEHQPKSMTLLLQKEVAERIAAKDKKESLLSISVKAFGIPKYVKTVGKGSFSPQPKVDSAIMQIGDISKSHLDGVDPQKFFEILKSGFSHKRKLLIKNLEILGKGSGELQRIFQNCGIPLKARAENLKTENWLCLTKSL